MPVVLAISTAEKNGEILLADAHTLLSVKRTSWGPESSHSEVIATALKSLCKESPLTSIDEIQAVYVIEGPGSFTGLRVGVNFAKTLAYGKSIPIFGVNTLLALAISVLDKSSSKLFTTLDAQKNSLFFSEFDVNEGVLEAGPSNQKISAKDFPSLVSPGNSVVGSGLEKYKTSWNKDFVSGVKTFPAIIDLSLVLKYQKVNSIFSSSPWAEIQPRYYKKSTPEELLILSRQRS